MKERSLVFYINKGEEEENRKEEKRAISLCRHHFFPSRPHDVSGTKTGGNGGAAFRRRIPWA